MESTPLKELRNLCVVCFGFFNITKVIIEHEGIFWYAPFPQLISSILAFSISISSTQFKFFAPQKAILPSAWFEGTLSHLPPSLKHLILPNSFNQQISFYDLPCALTHIKFGSKFNKKLHDFPPTITHLTFGADFNKPLPLLPPSLVFLLIQGVFEHPLPPLPRSLTHLSISSTKYKHPIPSLPRSLLYLTIRNVPHPLPYPLPLLSYLNVGDSFNHPIDHLPPTLLHLFLGISFAHPIGHLPRSLKHLKVTGYLPSPIDHLPSSITHLTILNYNFPVCIPLYFYLSLS